MKERPGAPNKNATVQGIEDDTRLRAQLSKGHRASQPWRVHRRRGNGRAISAHAGILMRIRWTPEAATDLETVNQYLRQHRPQLMQPTMRKLHNAAQSLARLPNRGRVGRREGTRELVCSPLPYIMAYRIDRKQSKYFTPITLPGSERVSVIAEGAKDRRG